MGWTDEVHTHHVLGGASHKHVNWQGHNFHPKRKSKRSGILPIVTIASGFSTVLYIGRRSRKLNAATPQSRFFSLIKGIFGKAFGRSANAGQQKSTTWKEVKPASMAAAAAAARRAEQASYDCRCRDGIACMRHSDSLPCCVRRQQTWHLRRSKTPNKVEGRKRRKTRNQKRDEKIQISFNADQFSLIGCMLF